MLREMNVDGLIEGHCLSGFASLVTLTSCPIANGVQILICRRTISRINLPPMSRVKTTASRNMSRDTIAKTNHSSLALGQRKSVIHKSVIVSPTMTSIVFGHYVERATHDNRIIFVATQIHQIIAIRKIKSHCFCPVFVAVAPF